MRGLAPHAMLPDRLHDERSRQDFVRTFRAHLSSRVMPGTRRVYDARTEPRFRAAHGRAPADRHEVRRALLGEPYYQFWSALQRRSQELMWESVIDPTERELPALIARAKALSEKKLKSGRPGTLRLDPALAAPRYHTAVDIHLQPGGYHTDQTADDVAAGALYDTALELYLSGALEPDNGGMGDITIRYLRERLPGLEPARVLDMGCAIGNSTLRWARAFPQAEIHGIDVGAPVLRYAHARARALGVAAHFSQQNAEGTDFPDASFDVVVSHIMLHETSKSALGRILRESLRLLRPGGVMIHLELPKGTTPFEQCMLNWETWNNNEMFSGFLTDIDLAAEAVRAGFDASRTQVEGYASRTQRQQKLYTESFTWKVLAARR